MIYCIENENLSVQINSIGAELMSIKKNNVEYLWNGNRAYWKNRAPMLFPIVGGFIDNNSFIEQQQIEMEKHGFLKNLEFEKVFETDRNIVLKAGFNQDTYKIYPYKFTFIVNVTLENNTLKQQFEIINEDDKDMIYGFGLHPGIDLENFGGGFSDYYIDFNEEININKPTLTIDERWDFENTQKVDTNCGKLQFSDDLFLGKPIILNNLKSKVVSIKKIDDTKILDFKFENFELFGMWHASNTSLICLEPWTSHVAFLPYTPCFEENKTMRHLKSKHSDFYKLEIDLHY